MSLAVRVISIIAWVLVQITYGTALFSPYFRRMSLDIMRRIGVILFVIAQLVVTGTLISIFVVWPSCDVFNVGILLYCISAIFWVPFVLARFPIAIQRVPLVFSLFGALLTTGGQPVAVSGSRGLVRIEYHGCVRLGSPVHEMAPRRWRR